MKSHEFINEARVGKIPKSAGQAAPIATIASRDVGGYDRTNHMNRVMMAVACADGQGNKIDMDSYSYAEKYNTIHPYTPEEHRMVDQALKAVPSEYHHLHTPSKSQELSDTNKTSPHSSFRGFADMHKTAKKSQAKK